KLIRSPMAVSKTEYSFPQKVWIAGGIIALITIMIFLLKATFNVMLLILAGTLIAVYFRGLADLIRRNTRLKHGACMAISIGGSILLLILVFWMIGAKLQEQITALTETMPTTIENAKNQLNETSLGKKLVDKLSSPQAQKDAEMLAGNLFKSTFGLLGDIYVILFIGIFFTVSPKLYTKGIVQLAPPAQQNKADDVVNKMSDNLKKWLKGQLFAMLVVMILTGVGLLIIGVPMWLALAVIAGLLNFIPNFGPIIAMIPAVLIGLMESPSTAMIVAGLYILIQVIESNFITPMVQQKLVSIPPALIIIAQLLIAPLTGVWGLVLATPLMVITIVLVKELYVNNRSS
ncbi:MAG: AI-2E family transporter, partial [Flavisolibacter sp.]